MTRATPNLDTPQAFQVDFFHRVGEACEAGLIAQFSDGFRSGAGMTLVAFANDARRLALLVPHFIRERLVDWNALPRPAIEWLSSGDGYVIVKCLFERRVAAMHFSQIIPSHGTIPFVQICDCYDLGSSQLWSLDALWPSNDPITENAAVREELARGSLSRSAENWLHQRLPRLPGPACALRVARRLQTLMRHHHMDPRKAFAAIDAMIAANEAPIPIPEASYVAP